MSRTSLTEAYLNRMDGGVQGTSGILVIPGSFSCFTLELPWRNNQQNVSCIPDGDYEIEFVKAGSRLGGRRWLYWVHPVEGRSGILIHAGNWAGDPEEGYRRNSYGCPLLGMSKGSMGGQRAVFQSRKAVRRFIHAMGKRPGRLHVRSMDHVRNVG